MNIFKYYIHQPGGQNIYSEGFYYNKDKALSKVGKCRCLNGKCLKVVFVSDEILAVVSNHNQDPIIKKYLISNILTL